MGYPIDAMIAIRKNPSNILCVFLLLAIAVCGCCEPDCKDKCCGDDGCGGSCPDTCEGGQICMTHWCRCASCYPDCEGKCCGEDGCDGTCGDICPIGFHCNTEKCICEYGEGKNTCFSIDKRCGTWDDGQGGQIECGICPNDEPCDGGSCVTCKPWECNIMEVECGIWDDGCGGEIDCGICLEEDKCDEFGRCVEYIQDTIGSPCPYSHVNGAYFSCELGLICVGDSYLGECYSEDECGIPEKYHPDCFPSRCGFSFCSKACDGEQCPAGFVEDTSLGTCYCFPE
jgi:hypothetical protein